MAYEPLNYNQTRDLKKTKRHLHHQQQEIHDSQEFHLKALLLDMNVLYSMEEAIGCALDKQNQELFSLSNQAIGFSEHNKMATR